MSFKLRVIRPLEGRGKKILKVLKLDYTYQFYNEYAFHSKEDYTY